jgi:hypothetical protein
MKWAVQTVAKERNRKYYNKKVINPDGNGECQDKKMFYCKCCKVVFQHNIASTKRYNKGNVVTIYEDFPTIGKERVESCPSCK